MKTTLTSFISGSLLALFCATNDLALAAEPGLPSDLLERAIYAEETKGDLNSAVALYQQLVSDAKAFLERMVKTYSADKMVWGSDTGNTPEA